MNQTKTLSEICKDLNVSRKVIQGYEKHGLVGSCGKDKNGRRIYDGKTVDRIIRIRFYQKIGFSIKEIKDLIDRDDEQIKHILLSKQADLDEMIRRLARKRKIISNTVNEKELSDIGYMYGIAKKED